MILIGLSTALLAGTLSGCSGSSFSQDKEPVYEETLTVDVFDSLANYQGIQSGWFAKIVKDKFNIELNYTDKIITLSTCDDTGTKRVVIHAKLINIENK